MDTQFSRRHFLKLCLAASTLTLGSCNVISKKQFIELSQGDTVLCLGDSLTYGTGVEQKDSYPAQLQALLGPSVTIVNEGIPGETSIQILARTERLLQQHRPAATFITAGGNDFLRNQMDDETKLNLRQIINLCESAGSAVVMFAIPKPSLSGALVGLNDHEVFNTFKGLPKVIVIEDLVAEILSDGSLKSDLIHPNTAGYSKMASAAYALLKTEA